MEDTAQYLPTTITADLRYITVKWETTQEKSSNQATNLALMEGREKERFFLWDGLNNV